MRKQFRTTAARASALSLISAGLLAPSVQGQSIEELKSLIQALDQKVKVLERKQELDKEAAAEKAKTTTSVSIGAGGLQIRSADTNFVLKLRGYVQADARFFPDDNVGGTRNDSFLLRRVRPIIEGTVYERFDYRLMLDFPSGLAANAANNPLVQDAYANARLYPWLNVQVGKFKEPVGLERLQSGANLLFPERSYPTSLLPNRDVGVQLHGDLFNGGLNYAVGVFNGVSNGGSGDIDTTSDDDKDFAARLFATPFVTGDNDWLRGLGFGVSGTVGNQGGGLSTYRSPGQQAIFTYTGAAIANGDIWRVNPQFYYYKGPFGIFGEYAVVQQKVTTGPASAELEHTAWQVSASWFLTGENNSFKSVTPLKTFALGGDGWGAFELAARVSQIDFDNRSFPTFASGATSASEATSWSAGVNWHLNRNIKASLAYEQTDFDGGTSPLLANGEKVVFSRLQFSF